MSHDRRLPTSAPYSTRGAATCAADMSQKRPLATPWRSEEVNRQARPALPRVPLCLATIALVLNASSSAGADDATPSSDACAQYTTAAELSATPQVFYIPPLEEGKGGFRPSDPGKLTRVHDQALDEMVERAVCLAHTQQASPNSIYIMVYPGTDDRAARPWLRALVRNSGASRQDVEPVAKSLADFVAARLRGEVVVNALREKVQKVGSISSDSGDAEIFILLADSGANPPVATRKLQSIAAWEPHARGFWLEMTLKEGNAPPPDPVIIVYSDLAGKNEDRPNANTDPQRSLQTGTKLSKRSLIRGFSANTYLGAAIPLSQSTRTYLHRELVMLGVGGRVDLPWVEVSPRLLLIGGTHGTRFNDIEQEQRVYGVGGMLQGCIPLVWKDFRFSPGLELGWLYMTRTIKRRDIPFVGVMEEQSSYMPIAGVLMRSEYSIGPDSKWTFGIELSGDWLIANIRSQTDTNFTLKALGGFSYDVR